MRRSEFKVNDPAVVQSVLDGCEYGVLSLISEGKPYGVALNFAQSGKKLYFHGALKGRKAEAIGEGVMASFLVAHSYAYIPSYFRDVQLACNATQLYASVMVSGAVYPLYSADEKAAALNRLMQKMQPEGEYEPITAQSPLYEKVLNITGVFAMDMAEVSLKVKTGQNFSAKQHAQVVEHLNARGRDEDREAVEVMMQYNRVLS